MELQRHFEIAKTELLIDQMSLEDLRGYTKELFKAYVTQQETYKELVGKSWGVLPESLG